MARRRVNIEDLLRKAETIEADAAAQYGHDVPPSREVLEHQRNEVTIFHLRNLLEMRTTAHRAFDDLPVRDDA